MAIAKSAIDAYLARLVDDLSFVKDLKPLEVEEELTYINPPPKFTAPLRTDQKVCFLLGVAYPEILLMTDLGLGKTVVSLELFNYFYSIGKVKRGLVFAPTDELVEGWEDEIKKWGFEFDYLSLRKGSSKSKWDDFNHFRGDGLILGTYAGIGAMVSELQLVKEGDTKRKRMPQVKLMNRLGANIDATFFDQSTCASNRSTVSFRVCNHFSEAASVRFGLAGRAFGRDPGQLFYQFYLADRGRAFGKLIGIFRDSFYYKSFPKWGGIQYNFRKRRSKQFTKFTLASSLRYSVDECVDLPPKVMVNKECEFPKENWDYFVRARDELLKAKGKYREVRNSFLQMRQISSGFVGFIDDESGDRAEIEFEVNPKLNLLMDIVNELPEDKKCIIIHEFTWSGRKISEQLTKAKLEHGWLYGGTKDWTPIKESFNNDDDYRFLVANWKKASMGLNLQKANYLIFYESPVAVIPRSETEGRVHRTGQLYKQFVYDLLVRDNDGFSIDELIRSFHKEGADLWKQLVDNPQRLLKGGGV